MRGHGGKAKKEKSYILTLYYIKEKGIFIMRDISYYVNLISNGSIKYKDNTTRTFRANSCAINGCAMQLAAQDWAKNKLEFRLHGIDIIYKDADGERRFLEVKSNSSPIEAASALRCSMIAYASHVEPSRPLNKQDGYVLPMADFLRIGKELKLIKSGTSCGGSKTEDMKTQTVYNNSKGDYHGTKWFKLEEEFLKVGALTFEEFFTEDEDGLN